VPGTYSTKGLPWIGGGFSKAVYLSLETDFILRGEVPDKF
jgi:hypothetical protein